jgi:hypothetical protein
VGVKKLCHVEMFCRPERSEGSRGSSRPEQQALSSRPKVALATAVEGPAIPARTKTDKGAPCLASETWVRVKKLCHVENVLSS